MSAQPYQFDNIFRLVQPNQQQIIFHMTFHKKCISLQEDEVYILLTLYLFPATSSKRQKDRISRLPCSDISSNLS